MEPFLCGCGRPASGRVRGLLWRRCPHRRILVPWVETSLVSGRGGVRNETFHRNVSTKTKAADLKIRATKTTSGGHKPPRNGRAEARPSYRISALQPPV